MKKAYNENQVNNLYIREKAAGSRRKNLLTPEQEAAVYATFPADFYLPGIFVRIGLFVFGLIACLFFTGFLSLFFGGLGSGFSVPIMGWTCCVCFLFFLEHQIKDRKLYHSGLDNALLYAALIAGIVPFFDIFDGADVRFYCLIGIAFLLPAILRYADGIASAIFVGLVVLLVCSILVESAFGKLFLPFALMILAACMYWFGLQVRSIYYRSCGKVIRFMALVLCYLAGNYLIVREGNAMLTEAFGGSSPQIAFAYLFYAFSIGIPVAYITAGLRTHDRIMLRTGLVALAFTAYTFEHYFSFLTAAQELTLVGAFLIVIAFAIIRLLHTPKWRVSDETPEEEKTAGLEILLVSQTMQPTAPDPGFKFGGGSFGGGGAGEVY